MSFAKKTKALRKQTQLKSLDPEINANGNEKQTQLCVQKFDHHIFKLKREWLIKVL